MEQRRKEHLYAVKDKDCNQSALTYHTMINCKNQNKHETAEIIGNPNNRRKSYL